METKVIYDVIDDRIWIGFEQGRQWFLFYEDAQVKIKAKTKPDLKLPTEQLFIIGEL